MSDIAFHRPDGLNATAWLRRLLARFARALDRTLFAHRIRYDLGELSDRLLRDIGLTRMVLAAALAMSALLAQAGSGQDVRQATVELSDSARGLAAQARNPANHKGFTKIC